MNLIEKVLGISPDGGNGITELTLLLALAMVAGAGFLALRRTRAARLSPKQPPRPAK